jgi:hypothetical protein
MPLIHLTIRNKNIGINNASKDCILIGGLVKKRINFYNANTYNLKIYLEW